MTLVAFDRRLWVCVAKSAFSLMVIYAQITLESIISLWCAVTAHNSWGDVDRDSIAALRKHNTPVSTPVTPPHVLFLAESSTIGILSDRVVKKN